MSEITTPPNVLYKQPSDNDLNIQKGQATFTEKWKGPYVEVQGIANNLYSVSADVSINDWSAGTLSTDEKFSRPSCPDADGWWFKDARVRELPAGQLAELYVTWGTKDKSSTSSIQWYENWDVNWQPYSVDPYAFCANPTNHISAGSATLSSQRIAIEASLNLPYKDTEGKNKNKFHNGKVLDTLNKNEIAIKNKKILEVGCEYHYPIAVQTWTAYNVPGTELSGGTFVSEKVRYGDIDCIVDSNSFYQDAKIAPSGWEWVCTASNVRTTLESYDYKYNQQIPLSATSYTVIVTNQFRGSISADINFYGPKSGAPSLSGRWNIGEM